MLSKTKKLLCVGAAAVALSGISVAAAETRDGGQWDHGSSGGRVWSHYWHPGIIHATSVDGHEFVDSGCQAPGLWARAQAKSKWFGTDGAYYRFC